MGRYTGPKDKRSRREGYDLYNKGEKLSRIDTPPGDSGHKRSRSTQFNRQLRAKQRIKRLYGLREKQFRNIVDEAENMEGDPTENLSLILERRLDNVLYRAGIFPTRPAARQFVVNGHVKVNEQKLDIPSYRVKEGDEIILKETAEENPVVKESVREKKDVPQWLERDELKVKVRDEPESDAADPSLDFRAVVGFYSR